MRLQILPDLDDASGRGAHRGAVLSSADRGRHRGPAGCATPVGRSSRRGSLIAFAAFAFLVDFAMLRRRLRRGRRCRGVSERCVRLLRRVDVASRRRRDTCRDAAPNRWPSHWCSQGRRAWPQTVNSIELVGWLGHGDVTVQRRVRSGVQISSELVSSPPLRHYLDRRARLSLRLAAYRAVPVPFGSRARPVVRAGDPTTSPATSWHSDTSSSLLPGRTSSRSSAQLSPRLPASRRQSPSHGSRRSTTTRSRRFRECVDYVRREYQPAATVTDGGEQYLIFTRRDRPVIRGFGAQGWPCFVRETSLWSRVGQTAE